MELQQILYQKKDGIGTITLNRPEKRNAMTHRMVDEIMSVLAEIETDKDVRVVILKGAGSAFSSGHDWKDPEQLPAYSLSHTFFIERRKAMDQLDRWIRRFWELPQPIIAQVHGQCMVYGVELAMNCDLVVAAEDAQFLWRPPGGAAKIAHLWPYLMNMRKAKEMVWTRPWISGKEAVELGIANRAVPLARLDQEVENMAKEIMKTPPEHILLDKLVVNKVYEIMGMKTGVEYGMEIHSLGHCMPSSEELWDKLEKSGGKEGRTYFK